MTIKLEVEEHQEVVAISFSTQEEEHAFIAEYERRLATKAKDEEDEEDGGIIKGMLLEYLELAHLYEKTNRRKDAAADVLIVNQL